MLPTVPVDLGLIMNATGDGVGVDQTLLNGTYVPGKHAALGGFAEAALKVHLEFKGGMTSVKIKVSTLSLDSAATTADLETISNLDGLPPVIEHTYTDPGGSHILDDVIDTENIRGTDIAFVQAKAAGVLAAADVVRVRGAGNQL